MCAAAMAQQVQLQRLTSTGMDLGRSTTTCEAHSPSFGLSSSNFTFHMLFNAVTSTSALVMFFALRVLLLLLAFTAAVAAAVAAVVPSAAVVPTTPTP
jgi:succinate-acetate transporter protein